MPMYLCINEGSKDPKQAENYLQCLKVVNSLHSNFLAFPTLLEISSKRFKHFWDFVRKNDNSPIECSPSLSTPNTQSSRNIATKKLPSWHPKYCQVMKMQHLTSYSDQMEPWTIPQASHRKLRRRKVIFNWKRKNFLVMMRLPRWHNKTGTKR